MDAVSYVGMSPPSALLSRSFADAAIARALHFSLSNGAPEPCVAATGAEATTGAAPPPAVALHGARAGTHHHHPPSPPPARWQLGPAVGERARKRAGKRRRPRPSKRAPTTYISTDAATFRFMVQRATGADDEEEPHRDGGAGLGFLLPHHHFCVEHLLPPDPAAHVAAAYSTVAPAVPAPAAEQPLFPTLDSWNVMYGKNELV